MFTTKDNKLAIFGNTLDDLKNKLITFNDVLMQGGRFGNGKAQIIPEENLTKVLSFDEAKQQLDQFNKHVVNGGMSIDNYFNKYQKGNDLLKNYVTNTDQQTQSIQGLIKASQKARDEQIKQNKMIEQSSLSSKVASAGMNVLSMAGNMLTMWAVSEAISTIYEVATAQDAIAEKAKELGGEFSNAQSDISGYKEQISSLYETINDSSSSIEEVTSARQQLLTIQNELIGNYGNEQGAIENITNAINGQVDALDELSQLKWQETLNEFNDATFAERASNLLYGYSSNVDAMLNEYGEHVANVSLAGRLPDGFKEAVADLLGDDISDYARSGFATITGNATEVYEKLLAIQDLANNFEFNNDSFKNSLTETINGTKEVVDKYAEMYNQYILNEEIFKNEDYTQYYKNLVNAYKEYQDAFAEGDDVAINDALLNYSNQLNTALANSSGDVADYFKGMYSDIQAQVGTLRFETDYKVNTDGVKSDLKGFLSELEGMSSEDILGLSSSLSATEEQKKAYRGLIDIADKYNLEVEQLIGKLEDMGLVQSANYQELVELFGENLISQLSHDDLEYAYSIENVGELTPDELISKIEEAKALAATAIDLKLNTQLDAIAAADETANAGDDYVKAIDYGKEAKEMFDNHLIGTDDFKTRAAYFSPTGADDAVNFAENYSKIKRYMTEDASGVQKFLYDLEKKGYASFEKMADGTQKWQYSIEDLEQAATDMGMGFEWFMDMFGRLEDYGFSNNFVGSVEDGAARISDLSSELVDAEAELARLKATGADSTAIEQQEAKVASLKNDIIETQNAMNQLVARSAAEYNEQVKTAKTAIMTLKAERDKILADNTYGDNTDAIVEMMDNQIKTWASENGITLDAELNIVNSDELESESIVNIESVGLEELKEKALASKDAVQELINKTSSPVKLNLDSTNLRTIENQISAVKSVLIGMQDEEGNIDITTEGAQEALNVLNALYAQKMMTSGEVLMSIDSSQLSGEVQTVISKLQEFQTAYYELQKLESLQAAGIDVDTSEAQTKVANLASELQNLPPGEAEILTTLIPDPSSASAIASQISSITPEMTVKAGVDETLVNEFKGAAHLAEGIVDWDNNTALVDSYSAITKYADGIINWDNNTSRVKTTFSATGSISWSGKSGIQYKGTMLSPAHASGTAYNVLNLKSAYANGSVALSHNEEALVNEVGTESIIRDGIWSLLPGGAHVQSLKKGDIIFSASQTKDLIETGKTIGHGKAYANGTITNVRELLSSYAGGSGGGSFGIGGAGSKAGLTGVSSYKSSVSKKSTTTTKTTSTAQKVADDFYDFVEHLLERTAETTEKMVDAIEGMASLADKMSANSKALSQTQKEISVNQQAYSKYLAQAKSVGLSETYAKQIREGSLNIQSITDENLKKKIDQYADWYGKAQDCLTAIRDLQKDEKELALDRLTYIEDYYDAVISLNEAYQDANDARIEFNDAIGSSAISNDVKQVIQDSLNRQNDTYDQALQQLIDYQNEFNSLVENGYLEEGSIEYFEAQAQIQEFTQAVEEAATAVIELQDKILEIDYTRLQQLIDGSDRRTEQLKNAQSLAESRNELISRDVLQEQVDSLSASLMTSYELRDKKLKEQNLYDVGSTRYQELAEEIAELDGEIFSNLEEIETIKDQIFENEFFNYEKEQANLEYFIGELEDFASLINDDALFDKAGRLTDSGYAKLSLIGQQMATSKQQIADATEALNKLDEMLANGLITQTEYDEKSNELLDTIRDSAIVTNDYKQEILDLYLAQAEKENSALKENISLRQQALQNEKAYWDYAESLKSKTKSVNELEARIAALKGTNNTAALAELKRLQAQLEEAQSDLDNTKRDHSYELMDEGYDLMADNLDSSLEDLEYSITHSTEKQLSVVQSMLSQMVGSYQEAFGKINSIITETGFVGSTNFNNTASNISTSTGAGSIANSATQAQSTVEAGSAATNINSNNIANGDHGTIETEINKEANTDNRLCAELKISRSSLSLQEGDSETISVSIRPNDAKNKTISWTSSNPNVVAVSTDGKVTGVAPGSAIVTASTTDGSGLRQTCKVTITKKPDPPKPPVTTNTSTNQANNGVIDVGDKVTFVSGVYHEDSYGRGRWGSYNLGKQVYITSLNPGSPYPIHISRGNGLGRNDLGWLKQNQIKGYSGGSNYINRRQWALIDDTPTGKADPGSEVVFTGQGMLLELDRGSMVFNKSQKEYLFDISKKKELPMPEFKVPTVSEISSGLPTVVGNDMSHRTEVTLQMDSLFTIEGNITKDALPGLEKRINKMIPDIAERISIYFKGENRKF